MLGKNNKRKNGFTIIEIMIVLAIAGLIMLIVFLAVPALQRAARNTQRKNDVSAIAAAISNYIDNDGGQLPTNVGGSGTQLEICGNAACTGNYETAKLGYYVASDVTIPTVVPSGTAPANPNTVIIVNGYACNSTETGLGSTSPRTAAILYAVETSSSGYSQQCLEQ